MMRRFLTIPNPEHGFLLVLILVQSMVFMTILTGVGSLGMYNLNAAKRASFVLSANYAAEAGADKAMFEINQNSAYTGTNTVCPLSSAGSNPVTLYSNANGRATYETCVTAGTITDEKIVYATGKVYIPASATTPKAVKKVKLVVIGTPGSPYTIQTGPGGLVMSNSATITTGPVFIGGYLTMSNSARIGSAASPIDVSVANMRCPVPINSTWPQICSMGTQNNPITMTNTAHIYGSVRANGQTDTAGLSNPGLIGSSGVAAVTLPDHDRTGQKTAAVNNLTGSAASCSGSQSKTWPANVKITGNVTLGNSCTVTISGDAWITGNISLSNSSRFVIANGVSSQPTVMIDGSSGITLSNQSVIATNSSGIGAEFITFYSAGGSCSPDCTSVTGSALNSSMNVTTVNIGNQGLAAGSTFYARWTGLALGNGGSIGSILAQKITLNNSGNITFGQSSGTGPYTWDVRYYESL